MKRKKLKEKLSEILDLPKDVLLNIPKITIIGNLQVTVENHLGIIEYTQTQVRINTNIGVINIKGKDIKLNSVLYDEILLEGKIEEVWLNNGEGG